MGSNPLKQGAKKKKRILLRLRIQLEQNGQFVYVELNEWEFAMVKWAPRRTIKEIMDERYKIEMYMTLTSEV